MSSSFEGGYAGDPGAAHRGRPGRAAGSRDLSMRVGDGPGVRDPVARVQGPAVAGDSPESAMALHMQGFSTVSKPPSGGGLQGRAGLGAAGRGPGSFLRPPNPPPSSGVSKQASPHPMLSIRAPASLVEAPISPIPAQARPGRWDEWVKSRMHQISHAAARSGGVGTGTHAFLGEEWSQARRQMLNKDCQDTFV